MIKTSYYYECDNCEKSKDEEIVSDWLCLSLTNYMVDNKDKHKHFCSLWCLKDYLIGETEESIIECLI